MRKPKLNVPDVVRQVAVSRGPEGAIWLRDLGEIVADLERRWGVRVGRTLNGGTASFVAEARTADGALVVLKIACPGSSPMASEAHTLIAAAGRGYVRAYRYDAGYDALLLERLGRPLHELGLPIDSQIEIICRVLRDAWMIPFEGLHLISGADKAKALGDLIEETWSPLGRPCSERAYETAMAYAEIRSEAFREETSVLAHGDAHGWNTLRVPGRGRSAFKFIDPDGLVAERAYDLSIPMREWTVELLAGDPVVVGRRRCALLSRLGAVDPEPIWQWAMLERVSNGLLLLREGLTDLGVECLSTGT